MSVSAKRSGRISSHFLGCETITRPALFAVGERSIDQSNRWSGLKRFELSGDAPWNARRRRGGSETGSTGSKSPKPPKSIAPSLERPAPERWKGQCSAGKEYSPDAGDTHQLWLDRRRNGARPSAAGRREEQDMAMGWNRLRSALFARGGRMVFRKPFPGGR